MNDQKDKNQKAPVSSPMGGRGRMSYIEKPQDFKGTMKKLFQYLKPYKWKILIAGFMAITASLLSVLGPWLLGLITSEVADAFKQSVPGQPLPLGLINVIGNLELSIGEVALVISGIYILAAFFNYFQSFMLIGMTQNLTYSMRRELSSKINRLPLKYFDDQQFGAIFGTCHSKCL